MKKYTKPTVNVVSLKSSDDIATSFANLRQKFIDNQLYKVGNKGYAVTQYAMTVSTQANS